MHIFVHRFQDTGVFRWDNAIYFKILQVALCNILFFID